MRLVAVSIVKNEADIIEAFVRHTQTWVDHHLVFDHASTDGTREILAALKTEGLAISLFTDDAPGHLQQFRSNYLSRLAVSKHAADWVLPLDSDEFLAGPSRSDLEQTLATADPLNPVSLALVEFLCTPRDRAELINPVLRVTHRRGQASPTRKIFLSRKIAEDPACVVGKGSHDCTREGQHLTAQPLPLAFSLAHYASRSPSHQVLRVLRAELQRLSRGRAAAGLDLHYRLGYQLLAQDPVAFLEIVAGGEDGLVEAPASYLGGPLQYTAPSDWTRVARSLLPYLEELARSHGRLSDSAQFDIAAPAGVGSAIRALTGPELRLAARTHTTEAFRGFTPVSGWGKAEGPVAEAFLPRFHWGLAPATELSVNQERSGLVSLTADVLTYSNAQEITVHLNQTPVASLALPQVNQRERLDLQLRLPAGQNRISFGYRQALVTPHDQRQLAVLFLSLQIAAATPP